MFSKTEKKVIEHVHRYYLPVSVIAKRYFKGRKKPLNPNAVVSSAILRINKKCEYHGLNWCIEGKGCGRNGKQVRVIGDK